MADSVPNTTQRESRTLTPQERNGQRFIKAGVCVLGIVFLVWLLLPEVGPRQATRQQQCKNNLKLIGLALHAYHDAWGSFPPAFVAGKDGKPIYEVALSVNGRARDVTIDAQGSVREIEDEVALASLPVAVRQGLAAGAGTGTIGRVESLTKNGKLVA